MPNRKDLLKKGVSPSEFKEGGVEIPKAFLEHNLNYTLIDPAGDGKRIRERGWTSKIRRYDDRELNVHLARGHNYGVQSNNSTIVVDGESRFLVVIDFDSREFQDTVMANFPMTLTTTSGSPKNCVHLWLASDNNTSFNILDENGNTLCDVRGKGTQVVAPGSTHQSGSKYKITEDIPIAFVPYAQIEAILKPYDKSPKKAKKVSVPWHPKSINADLGSRIVDAVSMESILIELGIDTNKNPTDCFSHSSKGGKCFSWNAETAHCFHCDGSWNKFSLIRAAKKLTNKETFDWFAEASGMEEQLLESRQEYVKEKQTSKKSGGDPFVIFSVEGQVESLFASQPFFYNKSGMFFLWNKELKKYEFVDDIDLLNRLADIGADTITTKVKNEILNALKQLGRRKIPKDIKKTWVQFQDIIFDYKTGEKFEASPEYFSTNPLPHKIGKTEDTPMIDRLFCEWVGEDYMKTLEEIAAYSCSSHQFMQRMIALVGGGSNGKGTFVKFLIRLLGEENCCSSEIRELATNQFETAAIYKKLLCVLGEISYGDLKNTNQVKKISGEDSLRFCFKGKTPFTEESITTLLSATNALPRTPDKTMGFYRKWLLVDFPNQFTEIREGLIDSIPVVEFENFCRKVLRILSELYKTQKFTNEGTFQERMERYEARSNPVISFVDENCSEVDGEKTELRLFTNRFNEFAKSKHLRVMSVRQVSSVLRDEGFEVGKRKFGEDSKTVILNLSLSNPQKLPKLPKLPESPVDIQWESNRKLGSSGSSGSFSKKKVSEVPPQEDFKILKIEEERVE